MASEVTYDSVIANMTAEQANAEQRAAEQKQEATRLTAIADQAQALGVDPATMSEFFTLLDKHEAVTKAQNELIECAGTVSATLKRGHQGLNEAHQTAPVAAAASEFYEG